jgi:hypothetical protein
MWQYRADTPRASGVKSLFLPTLARLRSLFSPYCCCGDNCASPCASAGRAASDPARSSTTRKRARYVRLVAPVRTYSAPPVAGSFIATAAASSSCGTYAHTHRTKPNLGRACASIAGAKPDAYGSCTARRAERGSAERLKDRLATDRARRRADSSSYARTAILKAALRLRAGVHRRISVFLWPMVGPSTRQAQSRQKSRNGLGESAV